MNTAEDSSHFGKMSSALFCMYILLSNPNIGVATVAAEAGHAQPSTTLAIYTQVYDKRRDEIRKQMSKELYK